MFSVGSFSVGCTSLSEPVLVCTRRTKDQPKSSRDLVLHLEIFYTEYVSVIFLFFFSVWFGCGVGCWWFCSVFRFVVPEKDIPFSGRTVPTDLLCFTNSGDPLRTLGPQDHRMVLRPFSRSLLSLRSPTSP